MGGVAKKTSTALIATLIAVVFFTTTISAFALEQGDTISYTAEHIGDYPVAVFETGKYKGICAQQGAKMKSSGRATIETRISNNSKKAKAIYEFIIARKWLEEPNLNKGAKNDLGLSYNTVYTRGRLTEAMVQIAQQGKTEWKSAFNDGDMNPDTINAVCDYYDNVDWDSITVPAKYEFWYCNAGNDQDFIIYRYVSEGKFKLKKASKFLQITG